MISLKSTREIERIEEYDSNEHGFEEVKDGHGRKSTFYEMWTLRPRA